MAACAYRFPSGSPRSSWGMTRVGVLRGSNRPSAAGGDHHVALDQKIPVYITYFTLRVNDDGSFTTFNDIYRYDTRMDAALNGKGYLPDPWASDERWPTTRVGGRCLTCAIVCNQAAGRSDFSVTSGAAFFPAHREVAVTAFRD